MIATKGGYLFRERSRARASPRRAGGKAVSRSAAPPQRRRRRCGDAAGDGYHAAQDFSPRPPARRRRGSLRRLRTDHIDVYQLHGPQAVLPDAVRRARRPAWPSGKVGAFGVGAESVRGRRLVGVAGGRRRADARSACSTRRPPTTSSRCVADRPVEVWARGVFAGGLLALGRARPRRHRRRSEGAARSTRCAASPTPRHRTVDQLAIGLRPSHPGGRRRCSSA